MGKIRVKTLGVEEVEEKEKKEAKKRQEEKKLEEKKVAKNPDAKEEEKVALETPSEEKKTEKEKLSEAESDSAKQNPERSRREKKAKFVKAPRSKKYQGIVALFEKNKTYSLSDGLDLLEKLQRKSFDETVELHLNTISTGISGNITLPHGTGKKTRVLIADEKLITEIEKGIISFDILVAHPSIMPKLARVAKILGPKGLMPNPKNATVTEKPEELVKKYEGGQISFKTEAKAPLLHISVGKMSFGKTKLTENIKALITAIKKENIQKITLKSSMSPGIKVSI